MLKVKVLDCATLQQYFSLTLTDSNSYYLVFDNYYLRRSERKMSTARYGERERVKSSSVNFIKVKRTNFSYERCFSSFFYVHVTRKIRRNEIRTKNAHVKCWWNRHLVSIPSTLNVRIFLYERRFGSFYYVHVSALKADETTFVQKIGTFNVDKIDTWSQFHRHYTNSFCATRFW